MSWGMARMPGLHCRAPIHPATANDRPEQHPEHRGSKEEEIGEPQSAIHSPLRAVNLYLDIASVTRDEDKGYGGTILGIFC
jgi:hypothetical protein